MKNSFFSRKRYNDPMKKIIVAGPIGAGKTTLSKLLSKKLSIQHFELDNIYWLPDWQVRPLEKRKRMAEDIILPSEWIICGNHYYSKDVTWARADTCIWLDYPLWLCFLRALKRGLKLAWNKKKICNGNTESFCRLLFSKNSVLLCLIKQYRKIKSRYSEIEKSKEFENLKIIRLRSPKETETWLAGLQILFRRHGI